VTRAESEAAPSRPCSGIVDRARETIISACGVTGDLAVLLLGLELVAVFGVVF
jgi:hypothetical protein